MSVSPDEAQAGILELLECAHKHGLEDARLFCRPDNPHNTKNRASQIYYIKGRAVQEFIAERRWILVEEFETSEYAGLCWVVNDGFVTRRIGTTGVTFNQF